MFHNKITYILFHIVDKDVIVRPIAI